MNEQPAKLQHLSPHSFPKTGRQMLSGFAFGLRQSLIQKQLAADLQALQEVSTSVSTSDSPIVWETIKTESVDAVAGIVETFFERYEEDPEGGHTVLRLLDPVTEIA